jgi:hypothetical protein
MGVVNIPLAPLLNSDGKSFKTTSTIGQCYARRCGRLKWADFLFRNDQSCLEEK